ncbi:hypothetical protein KC315_g9889 [Hortaea werneckii]|nr:hypothetical protein KC315_g9889 [Hortaea werneckii]KAI7369047.1 hypothetical protein KC354_g2213 [Hortaea werneckii]
MATEVSDNDETSQLDRAPNPQSNMTPQSETPDLMQTLPPELQPALLKTCRWIRNETRPIFWGNMPGVYATFSLSSPRFKYTVETLTSIVKTCGKSPFKKMSFYVLGPTRPHLINLLPLLEMMRATGFDPTNGTYEPCIEHCVTSTGKPAKRQLTSSRSIFHMLNQGRGALQEDLETAFALPRRAREEGWTAERFETEFKAFVKRKGTKPRPKKAKTMVAKPTAKKRVR